MKFRGIVCDTEIFSNSIFFFFFSNKTNPFLCQVARVTVDHSDFSSTYVELRLSLPVFVVQLDYAGRAGWCGFH